MLGTTAAAAATAPVAHAIVPVLRLLGHANGRHEDQLRHMLRMLQRVHSGEVAAHTAAAGLHNGARAVQAVRWRQHLWPANTKRCKPRSRRMPSKPCDKSSNTGGNATPRRVFAFYLACKKNASAASWSAASNVGRALAPMPSQSKANTSLSALQRCVKRQQQKRSSMPKARDHAHLNPCRLRNLMRHALQYI